MSLLLTATLFVSLATAQLTTSIWLPGAANANQSFVASVVSLQGDRTTLSVAFDGEALETEYYGTGPGLVTMGATTYVAYAVTASGSSEDNALTAYLECSRADGKAVPTCAMTTRGGGPKESTASLSDDDFDFPETTMTMSGDSQYMMNTYELVITAGTEKLKASAAATPTSGSGSSTAGGSTTARSTAGSSGVAQATGAAAPMLAMAPALAGLGAAAAFFV